MDGQTLLFLMREAMNEPSGSDYLNDYLSYHYLYDAACELNSRIAVITSSQTITTVADQAEYNLNADFMGLYLKDSEGRYFVKYYDGTDYTFLFLKGYESIYYDNQTTSVSIPDNFGIKYGTTQLSNIAGTASAGGTVASGEATLTDTSSATKFSNASAGDLVHDTTGSYHGVVIAKTSNTALVTAIFDSAGQASSWTIADSYVVVPQGRFSLLLDPPPTTAGHTITVPYIQKPTPVFAPYRKYSFPVEARELVEAAVRKYKYRDREPAFGDAYFRYFDRSTKLTSAVTKKSLARNTFSMNLKVR